MPCHQRRRRRRHSSIFAGYFRCFRHYCRFRFSSFSICSPDCPFADFHISPRHCRCHSHYSPMLMLDTMFAFSLFAAAAHHSAAADFSTPPGFFMPPAASRRSPFFERHYFTPLFHDYADFDAIADYRYAIFFFDACLPSFRLRHCDIDFLPNATRQTATENAYVAQPNDTSPPQKRNASQTQTLLMPVIGLPITLSSPRRGAPREQKTEPRSVADRKNAKNAPQQQRAKERCDAKTAA